MKPSNQIEKKVHDYIQSHNLLKENDTVIVGVSGGADSMMLIDFLYTYKEVYKIELKVAHIHHGIRDEADEDAVYVEAYCTHRGIPFFATKINIKHIANQRKISEEEAGRLERYDFFKKISNVGDKIATAHTMSDQAETLLMRFIRGTDTKGLAGIPVKREDIIRPILCLSRTEVETYCNHKNISFQIDHTNYLPIYTRNKIRIECLPYIKTHFNPNIEETLANQAKLYKEQEEFFRAYLQRIMKTCVEVKQDTVSINSQKLREESTYIQKKVIYESIIHLATTAQDITQKHIEQCVDIMNGQTGKRTCLPYGITGEKKYNDFILTNEKKTIKESYLYKLDIGNNVIKTLDSVCNLSLVDGKTFEQTKQNRYTKYIDYDKIKDNLHLRNRKAGDTITLNTGTKKLKKLFIDEKISKEERDYLPLVTDNEEVIWVVGSRLNSKYFVTEKTKNILEIQFTNLNTQEGLC